MNPFHVLAAISIAGTASLAFAGEYTGPETTGNVQSPDLVECSGLAISRRDPALLWAVNDSGGGAELHRLGIHGSDQGKIKVTGVINRDWEDMASFTLDGVAYLLIAETGDNMGFFDASTLYIIEEPAPPTSDEPRQEAVPVAWKVPFRFEDGPRDCEAVAVDVAAEKILLISKRDPVPKLYELPLRPVDDGINTAKLLGTVTLSADKAAVEKNKGKPVYAWQPTSMDIAADGSSAVITTYRFLLYFSRREKEPWTETFSRPPVQLPPHKLTGGCEAVTFSDDNHTLYLTSEKQGPPLLRYRRPTKKD